VYSYDDQNRVYQTQTFSVDQSTGSLSTYALTSIVYRNHRGETIETSSPGGLVNKSVYDGAGRLVTSYSTDGGTGSGWSNASTVTGDNVVEETINSYDSDDNLILTTTKRHDHDDTNTGELGNSSTTPKARVTYSVAYYDAINRVTATATVGTNGGSSYTRPSSVASRSDTNLVTSFTYNASTGWNDTSTDPKGIITAKYYDMMGRVVRQIEAYDGVTVPTISSLPTATSSTDRATVMTYDGLGHTLTLQAVMPSGTNSQTTQYNYGVTTSGSSFINTNNLLSYVQFPIASTGSPGTTSADKRTYTYNAVGQPLTYLDQNGTTHTYTYDVLGRKTADAVAVASGNPQGIDTSVLLQTIKFDTGHRPYQITQYNAVTSGTVVNQIEDLYNGLGQLADEYQAHGGTVNTSTSPVVVYGWSLMPSGANHSRLTSMQYPNGRSLDYVYNSGLDTTVSRISGLADDSSGSPATPHLEDYSYLGASAMVQRAHGQPGVALDLFGGTSGTYAGLDNFGRVIDQKWTGPSSTITDEFQYGYDRDSDPLYKNNTQITSLSELYHANSSTSGDNATAYDNLDRVNGFRRGTLSASGNNGSGVLDTVSTTSSLSNHSEAWSLDALGNWSSQTVDGGSAVSRTNNSKNEVTAVGSNSLTFDNNGNTTTDQTGQTYTYDAWNRLITVKSGTTTLATYAYDAHGWRVQETHSSTTTDCYFNHSWQLIEERQGSTVTNQYVWSLGYKDCLVLRDDNSTSGSLGISGSGLGRRLYAQQDCNWNTTALVNTSGAVQERFIYDPYGNVGVLNSSGSSTTDSYNWIYLHQGLRLDTATGLYNSRLRDYAPALGRWMEQDPGGYIDGANLYGYCDSSPLASTDPFGLAPNITDIRNNYAALLALEQQLEKAYNDPNNKLCPCDRDQLLATILAVQDLRAQAESAMAGADGALGQMRQAIKDYTNSNPAVAAALSAARGSLNQISDGAPNALANEPFLNAARDGLNDVNDMHGDLKNFSNALGALHDINVITGTNDPLQILGAVADLASEASGYANLPLGINTVVSQYISAKKRPLRTPIHGAVDIRHRGIAVWML
jgi:RHS repeat-associated protein